VPWNTSINGYTVPLPFLPFNQGASGISRLLGAKLQSAPGAHNLRHAAVPYVQTLLFLQ